MMWTTFLHLFAMIYPFGVNVNFKDRNTMLLVLQALIKDIKIINTHLEHCKVPENDNLRDYFGGGDILNMNFSFDNEICKDSLDINNILLSSVCKSIYDIFMYFGLLHRCLVNLRFRIQFLSKDAYTQLLQDLSLNKITTEINSTYIQDTLVYKSIPDYETIPWNKYEIGSFWEGHPYSSLSFDLDNLSCYDPFKKLKQYTNLCIRDDRGLLTIKNYEDLKLGIIHQEYKEGEEAFNKSSDPYKDIFVFNSLLYKRQLYFNWYLLYI